MTTDVHDGWYCVFAIDEDFYPTTLDDEALYEMRQSWNHRIDELLDDESTPKTDYRRARGCLADLPDDTRKAQLIDRATLPGGVSVNTAFAQDTD